MKNLFSYSLCLGLILVAIRTTGAGEQPTTNPGTSPSIKGRVLVLESERTLTGEIERVGDQYRIKRLLGETSIPASRVLKLCATLEEAYLFLQRRANLNDPDERVRLAEWCRQHGLKAQALVEVEAALRLKPGEERLKRLARYLQQAQTPQPASPAVQASPPPAPRVEVMGESLRLFATRVQPILLNACASCHVGNRGGTFQLTRVYGPALANRKSLERNLSEVMAQVNLNDPRSSKLLIKSLSLHAAGMSKEPFRNREAPAYRTLEDWVLKTVESHPHLQAQAAANGGFQASGRGQTAPWPVNPPQPEGNWGEDRAPQNGPAEGTTRPISSASPPRMAPSPATPQPGTKKPPMAPAVGKDPVDPDGFNREFHPGMKADKRES